MLPQGPFVGKDSQPHEYNIFMNCGEATTTIKRWLQTWQASQTRSLIINCTCKPVWWATRTYASSKRDRGAEGSILKIDTVGFANPLIINTDQTGETGRREGDHCICASAQSIVCNHTLLLPHPILSRNLNVNALSQRSHREDHE